MAKKIKNELLDDCKSAVEAINRIATMIKTGSVETWKDHISYDLYFIEQTIKKVRATHKLPK